MKKIIIITLGVISLVLLVFIWSNNDTVKVWKRDFKKHTEMFEDKKDDLIDRPWKN